MRDEPNAGEAPICPVCSERIGRCDDVTRRLYRGPEPEHGRLLEASAACDGETDYCWVHVACTADGVKRWLRAGRPSLSPVEWVRQNGLGWTGLDSAGYRGGMVGAPPLERG
jgi:hypothetical protein